MKIVIAGAGEVGSHLAKLLSNEEQDIILIDENAERLELLDTNYNLITYPGNPVSFSTLRDAGAGHADLFIAVTPYEANNMVACLIAKTLGAKTTLARITSYDFMDPANQQEVKRMGVDHVIYPEYLAAQQIITALRHPWARNWFELHDGHLMLVGVKLREGAPVAGMKLREFAFTNHNFHVSAIKRGQETVIPRGNDRMEAGDILYITTRREHVDDLIDLTGKTEHKIRRVLVMGASKIAVRVVALDENDEFKFTIIDKDREVCENLPMRCPGADEIYCGDARDIDTLTDVGINTFDAFIALSNSSEANILACLTAKEAGVKKTIAEVEDIQFINQAENLNIGTIVNKKLLASSTIFQLLLDADSSSSKCLALQDAEVAELEVKPDAKITRAPVKDLNLTHDMTIAGLIRDGRGQLVTGNTRICAGDHVVVFCLAGAIHKVERLFS